MNSMYDAFRPGDMIDLTLKSGDKVHYLKFHGHDQQMIYLTGDGYCCDVEKQDVAKIERHVEER